MAVDHCTAECIGLHAAKHGTRFEALEPIRQGMRERFGGIGDGGARGLRLRHDHGSNYLADDFQQEVAFFGIESSPSFVREPEGNGVAERFIRTLKENLLWVRRFATIEELRLALLAFKRTYNEQWMLEKYDYRSPAQVRRDLVGLDAVASKRIPSNHCPSRGLSLFVSTNFSASVQKLVLLSQEISSALRSATDKSFSVRVNADCVSSED